MPITDKSGEASGLAKQTMRELCETFIYCFTMELNRVSRVSSEAAVSLLQRWELLVGTRKPYFMFGPTQLNDMSAIIFGDTPASSPELTDFVLTLTISLQMHLARADQNMMDLFRDLTDSITLLENGATEDVNATARAYSSRFATNEMVLRTLKANRWLLTILLGSMFIPEVANLADDAVRERRPKK